MIFDIEIFVSPRLFHQGVGPHGTAGGHSARGAVREIFVWARRRRPSLGTRQVREAGRHVARDVLPRQVKVLKSGKRLERVAPHASPFEACCIAFTLSLVLFYIFCDIVSCDRFPTHMKPLGHFR